MKQLDIGLQAEQLINALCNSALKGSGIEAYPLVKQIETWLQTATEKPEAPTTPTKES
jgi:hypothetical protein